MSGAAPFGAGLRARAIENVAYAIGATQRGRGVTGGPAVVDPSGVLLAGEPLLDDGPDVAAVEALVRDDPSVKGIWMVPTYANPAGSVVTQEVASRLASMPTAAPDFRIFWDNAYAFHHLTEVEAKSADILSLSSAAGHPHRPVMFASTSKITYAGAGVAFLGGGQSAELASARLNAMHVRHGSELPWPLTFSFSRAIQQPALDLWAGRAENVGKAQQALGHRAACNSAAVRGKYDAATDRPAA